MEQTNVQNNLKYKFQHVTDLDADGQPVPLEARQIELTGKVVHFTLNEVLGDVVGFDKKLKELEGMRVLNDAKVTNITRQHPFVLDMSESDLMAAYLYKEAKVMLEQTSKLTAQMLEQKKLCLEEVADIKAQIPELADIPVVCEPMPSTTDANTKETSSGEDGADTKAEASGESKTE